MIDFACEYGVTGCVDEAKKHFNEWSKDTDYNKYKKVLVMFLWSNLFNVFFISVKYLSYLKVQSLV